MSAVLEATERVKDKNSTLTKIRQAGNIPAILNGPNQSQPIYVSSTDFLKTIRETGRNGIIKLSINNNQHSVMLHDVQTDPIKSEVIHADFQIVNMSTEVTVDVNLNLVGEAVGVKDGGVLQQSIHQISISALPTDIPQTIDVDVTHLGVGDVIKLEDIDSNGKYTINQDLSQVVASVLAPRQEEEISTGEEQEPGQPDNLEGRETNESE
ncbi:50S ribosomal protein L25/general stress protein Ctc [Fredinandcohnia sp. QZ13]|uniref:50S ribosomal protein L25/general stress protein Ctc n=1 Tax=Fredinandcohnia sp. QZ13 TaxID=3073144 RepID=UPI0028534A1A|nr:50S ribosomal protein L25/general stress protein Ctc [Fredinandcohnia sp. QZ13]MDR4888509.1 50S ribosomal protein L25/general stress protein Ctc [Fredinandcohnia sp. QZ13]